MTCKSRDVNLSCVSWRGHSAAGTLIRYNIRSSYNKHLRLYKYLMSTTQSWVVLLIVTKRNSCHSIIVWQREECIIVRANILLPRYEMSYFCFFYMYILQRVQLEVECNDVNILNAETQLVAHSQANFICCVDLTVLWQYQALLP